MKSLENFVNKDFLLTPNVLSLILKKKRFSQVWYLIVSIPDHCCLSYLGISLNIEISKATGTDGIGPRVLNWLPHICM